MFNEEIAKRITRGTTTNWNKVTVLYNDGLWALVKWPGCSYEQVSPWVTQYNLLNLGDSQSSMIDGQILWNCSKWNGDGPMNAKNLKLLVERQRLDPEYICDRPRIVKSKQEPKLVHSQTKVIKRRVKLDTCDVKLCLFVKGFEGNLLGKECDAALDKAKIVGEVDEVGDQINGSYIVLLYHSVTDLMEFIKNDREEILDTLESLT